MWKLLTGSCRKPRGITTRFQEKWCKTNECNTYQNNAVTIINDYFTGNFSHNAPSQQAEGY